MTDTSDKFDRLPHELEPTGAVQTSCVWVRVPRDPDYACPSCLPDRAERPRTGWSYCHWCGKPIKTVEAPQ